MGRRMRRRGGGGGRKEEKEERKMEGGRRLSVCAEREMCGILIVLLLQNKH